MDCVILSAIPHVAIVAILLYQLVGTERLMDCILSAIPPACCSGLIARPRGIMAILLDHVVDRS